MTPQAPNVICCEPWAEAHRHGHDNESYGPLIWDGVGYSSMGCNLPPIRFCPWCGSPKAAAEEGQ